MRLYAVRSEWDKKAVEVKSESVRAPVSEPRSAGFAWSRWQWNGVCALGASFFGAALVVWAFGSWESEGGARRAGPA